MTRVRRCAVLLVLTVAVVLGASLPANALFADTAAPTVAPAITAAVVTGPGNVKVDTECVTTTTVVKRVYSMSTGAYIGSTTPPSTTVVSTSNVESDTTTRADNTPVVGQYTLTQTVQNTMLNATATWKRSQTPGITGYTMTAFLYGSQTQAYPMGTAAPTDTKFTGTYDASVVNFRPVLSMVTNTSYGWTAPGSMSNVVTC